MKVLYLKNDWHDNNVYSIDLEFGSGGIGSMRRIPHPDANSIAMEGNNNGTFRRLRSLALRYRRDQDRDPFSVKVTTEDGQEVVADFHMAGAWEALTELRDRCEIGVAQ